MPPDVNLSLDRLTLDLRSPAGRPFDGASRILTNALVQENGGLRRIGGFPRLGYADEDQVNQDLHDQLLWHFGQDLSKSSNEPITLLFEAKSSIASRRVLAATRSRIYVSGGKDRNWRMIGWGFGGGEQRPDHISDATRFYADELGDIIILTNGMDRPMWTTVGAEPDKTTGMAVQPIDDLIALGVTTAAVVCSYRGFIFLGNVVMEGTTYRNRILWSDFNDPLTFTPLPNGLAGMVDLAADEEILAMKELGGSLRCYTTHRIYDVNLVGGEEIFNFRQIWEGPEVLRYRNSLVSTGNQHLWVGEDRIYYISETDRRPRADEWLYAASGAIFVGIKADVLQEVPKEVLVPFGPIDQSSCWALTGGFDDIRKSVWLSWPSKGETANDISIVLHVPSQRSTIVTRGFTAFLTHSKAYRDSVRKWLADNGICPPKVMVGEGNPAPMNYKSFKDQYCWPSDVQFIKNRAECSGLIPEYAQWLADHELCNGNPNPGVWPHPPIPDPPAPEPDPIEMLSHTMEPWPYLSEYVIRPSGDASPDEFLTDKEKDRLRRVIKQQYTFFNPTANVRIGGLTFKRSSTEASVMAFESDTACYASDLATLCPDEEVEGGTRLNDYWLVFARIWISNRHIQEGESITSSAAPVEWPLAFYFFGDTPPDPGSVYQGCADAQLTAQIAQHNIDFPDDKIYEVNIANRTWRTNGDDRCRASLNYLYDVFGCNFETWQNNPPTGNQIGGCYPGYDISRSVIAQEYYTLVSRTDPNLPVPPNCEGLSVILNKPTTPIVIGVPFDITAIVRGIEHPKPVDEWVYTWALEGEVPGVSEIVSQSGSIVTLKLGDTDARDLTLVLEGTGCGSKAYRVIVQAHTPTTPTPPQCPVAALILVVPSGPPPYAEEFTVTLVVNTSPGMTSPSTWDYTWSLTNTFAGVTEIVSQNRNVVSVKIGDLEPHEIKVVVDFKLPGCTYPEPKYTLKINKLPPPPPCDCAIDCSAICEYLTDPKCDECSEGWVFIAAAASFLGGMNIPEDNPYYRYPVDYSLKEYSTTELRWDYYRSPKGPILVWDEVDHPTIEINYANYLMLGYSSLVQVDSNTFGTQNEKRVRRTAIDYATEDVPDELAAWLHVWTGTGAQAGQLLWTKSKARRLDRLSLKTSVGHRTPPILQTRPSRQATYAFFQSGTHIAFRIIIAGEDIDGDPVVGGAVSLNWMKATILGAKNDYF